MALGRPITPIMLSEQEQTSLQNWARRPKSAQALAQRARTIVLCVSASAKILIVPNEEAPTPDKGRRYIRGGSTTPPSRL